ncbi:serine/threonine-protein kinase tnni3k-related [Anaeramoeba flamelloides]|uniref:Serine/threonine-protein kinase tnni3k-related n=1 Tax=Anaeramoeba flamelloides TaxID=1746091 RepID=A0ABQ8YC88_9EUKA|nr:serine/threonine-protein kinase tnni3k-related [Anaeramoeba flamelloides]
MSQKKRAKLSKNEKLIAETGNEQEIRQIFNKTNVNSVDVLQRTPLHLLCSSKNLKISTVEYLISQGADCQQTTVTKQTILHTIVSNPVINDLDLSKIVELFLSKDVDPNISDRKGQTCLHVLCSSESDLSKTLQILLDNKANPSIQIFSGSLAGFTPLHCLCRSYKKVSEESVKALVFSGAKLNCYDRFGNTILHLIAQNLKITPRSVSLLLSNGCPYTTSNHGGEKPIDIAIKNENKVFISAMDKFLQILEYESSEGRKKQKKWEEFLNEIDQLVEKTQEISDKQLNVHYEIGEGAFKVVYKGEWMGQIVAISKIKEAKLFSQIQIQEFVNELSILCKLRHPKIVTFFGGCTRNIGSLILVSEFCEGGDLFHLLHSKIHISKKKKIKIAKDICSGVQYLHSKNIIHRDLKSPNVLLDEKHNAKLTDFGLSKSMDISESITSNNTIVGTPRWMAPELLRGDGDYTNKVDIYALGLILYEISLRKIPFKKINIFQLPIKVGIYGIRPKLKQKDLFSDLIGWCWHQNPDKRPDINEILLNILEIEKKIDVDYLD